MGGYKKALLVIFLFLGMSHVNAAACDNSMKVEYQNRAKNITYSYTYNDTNNTFNILFTNITDSLYLIDMNTMQEFRNQSEITIYNVIPGNSYRYGVFTSDLNPCSGSSIYNIYVTLPFYNPYYKDSLCDGISHKYCQKFINKAISYDEFKENINEYRNKLISDSDSKKDDLEDKTLLEKIFDYLLNFYIKYYFVILPLIIIITVIEIIRINKKDSLF